MEAQSKYFSYVSRRIVPGKAKSHRDQMSWEIMLPQAISKIFSVPSRLPRRMSKGGWGMKDEISNFETCFKRVGEKTCCRGPLPFVWFGQCARAALLQCCEFAQRGAPQKKTHSAWPGIERGGGKVEVCCDFPAYDCWRL